MHKTVYTVLMVLVDVLLAIQFLLDYLPEVSNVYIKVQRKKIQVRFVFLRCSEKLNFVDGSRFVLLFVPSVVELFAHFRPLVNVLEWV